MGVKKDTKSRLIAVKHELEKRLLSKSCKLFINKYCKIELEGGGIGDFILRDYQEEYIDTILKNKKTVALKARQMGFSWVIAALFVWYSMFTEHAVFTIMSKSEDDAIDQLKRIKFIINQLPKWLQPVILVNNATNIELANGSRIYSLTSGGSSGRGKTPLVALWDEAAFTDAGDEIYASLSPAANKGKFILQSTPRGAAGRFYSTWVDNETFAKYKCDWRRHPERDEAWAISEGWNSRNKKDAMIFEQEYGLSFLGSEMAVFDLETVSEYLNNTQKPLEVINNLRVYKQPDRNRKYVLGVDVAEGLIRGDYSTIVVLEKSMNEVVAVYRERVDFSKFAKCIQEISYKYNRGLVAVERNNHGHAVIELLKLTRTPLYHSKTYDNIYKKWTSRVGWTTNTKTKPIAIDELERQVSGKELGIPDERILTEMQTFVYAEIGQSEKMGALKGHHDDLIMALAIAVQALKDVFEPINRTIKVKTEMDLLKDRMRNKNKKTRKFVKTGYR